METEDKIVESHVENGGTATKENLVEGHSNPNPPSEPVENNNLNGNKNEADNAIFTGPSNDINTGMYGSLLKDFKDFVVRFPQVPQPFFKN